MKSRTSFFKFSLLRKDLIRFCPAWIILCVFLFMTTLISFTFGKVTSVVNEMGSGLRSSAILNMFYAMLCAQMLFGDLFKTRLCNALHALPVRRESWFLTHYIAGLLYGLIPSMMVGSIYFLLLPGYRLAALLWVAGFLMQYVFFFSLAALCAILVGNRFAMVLLYGIFNFLAVIVLWFFIILYQPLLPGVEIEVARWMDFCPVYEIASRLWFVVSEVDGKLVLGDGFLYGMILFALSFGFTAAALLLYRKRQLERAGDFLAFSKCGPFVLILYAFFVASFFHITTALFGMVDAPLLVMMMRLTMLTMGLVLGYFTGMMLLKRTVRVFRWKAFAGFALMLVSLYVTLGVTLLDPMGLTRWVPNPEMVRSVSVNPAYQSQQDMTEKTALEAVTDLHRLCVKERWCGEDDATVTGWKSSDEGINLELRYVMKSGRVVCRTYVIPENSQAEKQYFWIMSQPENSLGDELNADGTLKSVLQRVEVDYLIVDDRALLEELEEALFADAKDGNLCQEYDFYRDLDHRQLELKTITGYEYIRVTPEAQRTWAWMQFHLPAAITDK